MYQVIENDPRIGLPSASDTAFWNCCGQWQLKQSVNPDLLSQANAGDEYTEMGSKIDKARETGNTLELSEEETELYENGLKYERLLLARWLEDLDNPKCTEALFKERLWAHDTETLEPVCSGESDVRYETLPLQNVLIIDYKLVGCNVSRAERNTQLRILSVLKWLDSEGVIQGIRAAINRCMPKFGGNDWVDYTISDLQRAAQWMFQHIWMSRQPDAPLTAGPWCLHCPCRTFCPQSAAYSMLPSVVAARALPFTPMLPKDVDEAVARLGESDLIKLWQSKGLVEAILKAVVTRLKAMPDEALAALGIERGKGRENNTITDITGALVMLKMQGWSEKDIYDCMEFSNTKLAKRAKIEKGLPSDKAATAWIRTVLADDITKTESEKPLRLINE